MVVRALHVFFSIHFYSHPFSRFLPYLGFPALQSQASLASSQNRAAPYKGPGGRRAPQPPQSIRSVSDSTDVEIGAPLNPAMSEGTLEMLEELRTKQQQLKALEVRNMKAIRNISVNKDGGVERK